MNHTVRQALRIVRFLPSHVAAVARASLAFASPLTVLRRYMLRQPPPDRILRLRGGRILRLSDNPYDIVTAFVVFARREYGAIPRGGTVLDVGGNIGSFALFAMLHGAGRLVAVEPSSSSFEVLSANLRDNGFQDRAKALHAAVSDRDGVIVHLPRRSDPCNQVREAAGTDEATEAVSTISLDALVGSLGSVDLLKMDIEGHEYKAVPAAAPTTLAKVFTWRMEYHHGPLTALLAHLEAGGLVQERRIVHSPRSGIVWLRRASRRS